MPWFVKMNWESSFLNPLSALGSFFALCPKISAGTLHLIFTPGVHRRPSLERWSGHIFHVSTWLGLWKTAAVLIIKSNSVNTPVIEKWAECPAISSSHDSKGSIRLSPFLSFGLKPRSSAKRDWNNKSLFHLVHMKIVFWSYPTFHTAPK